MNGFGEQFLGLAGRTIRDAIEDFYRVGEVGFGIGERVHEPELSANRQCLTERCD